MPLFSEKFLLGVLAACFIAVTITNPMKLDTTQRVSAAFVFAFTALFIGHTLYKAAHPPVPSAPVAEERYAVNWDIGIIASDHRTTVAGVYLLSGSGSGKDGALFPANVTTHLTITNRRARIVMINRVKVEMLTTSGEFVQLDDLSILGLVPYAGVNRNNLSPIEDAEHSLENVIKDKQLQPYEPIRGWLFFQYPKDIGRKFQSTIRLIISDYSGDPPFTTEAIRTKDERTSQPASMFLGAGIDLSLLPIQFMSDQIHGVS